MLHRLLRPAVKKGLENPELTPTEDLMIAQSFKENCNSYYRVRPFVHTKRLRIMVVVAKKEVD
ncbi:MAG: hypothetical protein ACK41Q_11265 [Candidatus Brocadia sp.]